MPAIITNAFRTYNADNFIQSLKPTTDTPAGLGNKIYLLIAKDSPWSGNSAGQYADGTYTDSIVPSPIDTTVAPFLTL